MCQRSIRACHKETVLLGSCAVQARAAASGIDALSKDMMLSRVRECEVAALRERAEAAEASLVRAPACPCPCCFTTQSL